MKPKIFTFTTMLLLMAGSFYACQKEKNQTEPFLTVDETPVTATTVAGSYSIAVSSNGEWTAVVEDAANNDWCTLTNTSGNGNGTITINVAENTSLTARTATVKITSGSLTKSVVINQAAAEGNFPQEIAFTEYSLAGTSCQWVNLNYDNKVIIINSNNELASYIACTDGDFPAIDFSKHTLLLASGTATHNIYGIPKSLWQLSPTEYVLEVETRFSEIETWENIRWIVAIVTEKISKNSTIEVELDEGGIIGKWKLIQIDVPAFPPDPTSYNYSQYNIIYEFKMNGIFTVSGDIDGITYVGHRIGEHSYFIVTSFMIAIDYQIPLFMWSIFSVFSNYLIINDSPFDGPIYSFVKLQ